MTDPAAQRDLALHVLQRLREAGFESLWAGGCVRDQLLGIVPKDYDVATNAHPDQVRAVFGRRRTLAIGASFGVIAVLGAKGLRPIDVATFRTDGAYRDGRHPESVVFTSAEHDARRRDFTINGLFYDPLTNRVVDYVNGQADLAAGLVRAIGDPAQRFAEDKLRLLRAIRFAATYGFALEEATAAAVTQMADAISVVSAERIAAELRRLLEHPTRGRGVELLAQTRLLAAVLPEVSAAIDDESAWAAALDRLERLPAGAGFPLALAALLLGAAAPEDVPRIGRRLKLANKEIDRAAWLVRMLPQIDDAERLPWPRLQRILSHDGAAELIALAQAHWGAGHAGIERCRTVLDQPAAQWNPPPLVSGDDLVAAGLRPGRQFAALLDHLRDLQLTGRLTTPAEALAEAAQWTAAEGPVDEPGAGA